MLFVIHMTIYTFLICIYMGPLASGGPVECGRRMCKQVVQGIYIAAIQMVEINEYLTNC